MHAGEGVRRKNIEEPRQREPKADRAHPARNNPPPTARLGGILEHAPSLINSN